MLSRLFFMFDITYDVKFVLLCYSLKKANTETLELNKYICIYVYVFVGLF